MRKRLAFLFVLLIVFLLSGCSTIPLEKKELEEYKNIAIQELNIYLETKLANNFYDDAGHNTKRREKNGNRFNQVRGAKRHGFCWNYEN